MASISIPSRRRGPARCAPSCSSPATARRSSKKAWAAAPDTTLAFLKEAVPVRQRPRIYVRINGLQTGLTDADLDVIVAGRPDGVMFPKAEGGAAVVHCDAKLTA